MNIIAECDKRIEECRNKIELLKSFEERGGIFGYTVGDCWSLIAKHEEMIKDLEAEKRKELDRLVEKWTPVLQYTDNEPTCHTKVILESEEKPYIYEVPECIKRIEIKYEPTVLLDFEEMQKRITKKCHEVPSTLTAY
jgi:hypothetical protein